MVVTNSKQRTLIYKSTKKRLAKFGWYATIFAVILWPLYLRDKRSKFGQENPDVRHIGNQTHENAIVLPLHNFHARLISRDDLWVTIRRIFHHRQLPKQKYSSYLMKREDFTEGGRKIKGVHLFSDSSPITFWEDYNEEIIRFDLQQILKDGFNTVILVIPWAGLQVDAHENLYDPWLYERLIHLLRIIDDSGLFFITRVGYTHNLMPRNNPKGNDRCAYVMHHEDSRLDRWRDYLESLQLIFDEFDNSLYSFFSWEDFFCGKSMMESSKSQRFLHGKASTFNGPIPANDGSNPDHVEQWYNHMSSIWMKMLTHGQKVMKDLTMEIRVDSDPIFVGTNDMKWFGYRESGTIPKGARVATYFSPYFGQRNTGAAIKSSNVAGKLEYMLKEVVGNRFSVQGSLLDQFNFVDNTPGFLKTSDFMAEYDIIHFLRKSTPLLQNYTSGYALWAYRNYRESWIYNGSFKRGILGWTSNNSESLKFDGSYLYMDGPVTLSTSFKLADSRCDGEGTERHICFKSSSEDCEKIQVCLDDLCDESLSSVDISGNCISMKSRGKGEFQISFTISKCTAKLGKVEGWCHEQNLGVRHTDGSPGPYLASIRKLNQALG